MIFKLFLIVAAACTSSIEASNYQNTLCPCGWGKILNGCYLFGKNKVTWDTARVHCLKSGGELVVPTSSLQCILLSQRAKSLGMSVPWIGVFRRFDGKFYDTCGKALGYSRWAPGEPNHSGNKENCVHMYTQGRQGEWNDIHCNAKYGYICQYKVPRCD